MSEHTVRTLRFFLFFYIKNSYEHATTLSAKVLRDQPAVRTADQRTKIDLLNFGCMSELAQQGYDHNL